MSSCSCTSSEIPCLWNVVIPKFGRQSFASLSRQQEQDSGNLSHHCSGICQGANCLVEIDRFNTFENSCVDEIPLPCHWFFTAGKSKDNVDITLGMNLTHHESAIVCPYSDTANTGSKYSTALRQQSSLGSWTKPFQPHPISQWWWFCSCLAENSIAIRCQSATKVPLLWAVCCVKLVSTWPVSASASKI